ncbi:MAG: gephyrin-like molybdotransferase Glp [Burkholderiaceae bacterium]
MPQDLLPLEAALEQLLQKACRVAESETIPTMQANRRVLTSDIVSSLDVPPWDNTQMDGYVVRAGDVRVGVSLPVSQRIPAGSVGTDLEPGTAARIFTGAAIPSGADAVVMQEETEADGDQVRFKTVPSVGQWIRRQGEDIKSGSVILPAGTRLSPQAIGLAASVGLPELSVSRPVRVACFFTGDELTMPGEPLKPGAIYNSNRFVLVGLLKNLGCEVTDLGIVPDSLEATRRALREAAAENDLIVTSGGVSVGEEDHVKPAVEAEGELQMWKLNIKPGKPLAYGQVRRPGARVGPENAHFIGLPGNPVSSFVTFLLLVRPFILRLQGATRVLPAAIQMPAAFDLARPDRRREFLRAAINESGTLDLYRNQSSAVLTSTVWGDGLIDNPPGVEIKAGAFVRFLPFDQLLF